jgi:deoxyhypusine synthase
MYFHSYKNPGLVVDILEDLKRLNTMAVKAANSGMIIIGGGLIKHHICNANLMVRNFRSTYFLNVLNKDNHLK